MKESANIILYCVCSLLSSLPLFSHSSPSFLPFSQSFLSASCVWFPSPLSYCSHVWILPFRVLKLKTYSAYDIDSHTVIYYGKLRQVIRSLAFLITLHANAFFCCFSPKSFVSHFPMCHCFFSLLSSVAADARRPGRWTESAQWGLTSREAAL